MRARAGLRAANAAAALALVSCADLIGAGFDDYRVADPAGATSVASATSTGAGGDGGGGGGEGGSGPTTSSSASTGSGCEEWPADAGAWVWATSIADDEVDALQVAALVPTASTTYPWAVVAELVGTLFSDTPDALVAVRPSPVVVPVGPAGVHGGGATHMPCEGSCTNASVRDAAADPPTWGDFGEAFWAGGSFSGEFLGQDAGFTESAFIVRFFANEGSDAWAPGTTWTTSFDGVADQAVIDAVSADDALVAFAGVARSFTLFELDESPVPERFFLAVGQGRYPLLLAKRAAWLGGGLVSNACAEDDDTEHAHDLDVELVGDQAWVAGRYCGNLAFSTAVGNEPGDGFVTLVDMSETGSAIIDVSASPVLVHGSPAIAVAAEDDTRAFLVGEIDPSDLTKSLPGDSSIFATSRDVWIARVDRGDDGLASAWSVQLDLPGEQHVHDVEVRRFGGGDDDLDVFVVGSSSAPIDLNGYPASCGPIEGRVGFVASLSGLDGSIRWIRSFGRSQAAALELAASEDGVVIVGRAGPGAPTLSPAAGGAPIVLSGGGRSIFVAELTR